MSYSTEEITENAASFAYDYVKEDGPLNYVKTLYRSVIGVPFREYYGDYPSREVMASRILPELADNLSQGIDYRNGKSSQVIRVSSTHSIPLGLLLDFYENL